MAKLSHSLMYFIITLGCALHPPGRTNTHRMQNECSHICYSLVCIPFMLAMIILRVDIKENVPPIRFHQRMILCLVSKVSCLSSVRMDNMQFALACILLCKKGSSPASIVTKAYINTVTYISDGLTPISMFNCIIAGDIHNF